MNTNKLKLAEPIIDVKDARSVFNVYSNRSGESKKEEAPRQPEDEAAMWRRIESLGWRNVSDGVINMEQIGDIVRRWRDFDAMTEFYEQKHQALMDIIRASDMFDGIEEDQLIGAASHAVMLGRAQYETIVADPTLCQFFIHSAEFQSAHDIFR